jgi:hypothetical protein
VEAQRVVEAAEGDEGEQVGADPDLVARLDGRRLLRLLGGVARLLERPLHLGLLLELFDFPLLCVGRHVRPPRVLETGNVVVAG